jgi:predicted ATPase/class 3 adenylate cyclase/tetratricopeptide (TPR) repeat protein
MNPSLLGSPGSKQSEGTDIVTARATFLFTDIEGSTQKWEREQSRMAQAVAAHDVLLRNAVERHRGRVIKTTGDGIYASFADTADAVASVVAIQLGLADPSMTAGVQLNVRCGLHTGEAQRREGDFFGPTIIRTARVMSIAYGGQVLLSQAAAEVVRDRLPSGTALRALGEVRLKGLTGTEHVYQLLHPQLRDSFPALRSQETTPNNLPQQFTSFIGREREIGEIETQFARTRLLTLHGTGGLGKTRLALQIAASLLDSYRDGVWFVDLAAIRDSGLVASETARALGLREESGPSIAQTICAHLKGRALLLVLDNCEHLVKACADLANAILSAAPNVRILATSREPLHVPGEHTYPVLPLPVPDGVIDLEALSRSSAVRLFVDRAREHRPSFALDESNVEAVARLVGRLEGIPLAVELAAARVRSLSVAEIDSRLSDRYKLLTGGSHVRLERQQTLRALVDWSYDLLHRDEQVLLVRLSIFAGGFDLSAAEEICNAEPLASKAIDDLLISLVDKSLVLPEEGYEGTRYRMLETIRDYTRMKLVESSDLDVTSSRHCNYYFVKAKAGRHGLQGPEQAKWVARLEGDHDNMRAAIAYSMGARGDPVIAVKMEVALQAFRLCSGYAGEGRSNIGKLLAHPAIIANDLARGHALYVGAALADTQGDDREAERMLETCLALRRGLASETDVAATLSTLAAVRLRLGDARRARAGEEEALVLFRRLGDRSGEAITLLHLGEICAHAGEDFDAQRFLSQSLAIAHAIDYSEIESECELTLGQLALERGDFTVALTCLTRSLTVCQGARDKRGIAMALWWLGKLELATYDGGDAPANLREALRAFDSFGMNSETIGALEDHARLAHSLGLAEAAARLYGTASAARKRLIVPRPPRAEARYLEDLAEVRAALTNSNFDVAWATGSAWSLKEAVTRALSLHAPTGFG